MRRALVRADLKRAGKLVNVSSRRPAFSASSPHDHRAGRGSTVGGITLLEFAPVVALLRNRREVAVRQIFPFFLDNFYVMVYFLAVNNTP